MINSVKTRTPLLALILFMFAVGYTVAATNKVVVIPMSADGAPSTAQFVGGGQDFILTGPAETVRSLTIDAPTDGTIMVTASGRGSFLSSGQDRAFGSINTSTAIDHSHTTSVNDFGTTSTANIYSSFATTRGYNVTAGTHTYKLVFDLLSGSVTIRDSSITAIFVPDSKSTISSAAQALSSESANNCDSQNDDCP